MKKLLLLLLFVPGMIMATDFTYGKVFETLEGDGFNYQHRRYLNTTIGISDEYIFIGGDGTHSSDVIGFEIIGTPKRTINSSRHDQIQVTARDLQRNKIVTLRLVDRVSFAQLYVHFENGSVLVFNFNWI